MADTKINYQVLNVELETILADLQSGELDIDEAVKKYQRGNEIIQDLQKYLKEADNKVKKAKADFSS